MLANTSQSRSYRPVFGGSRLLGRGLIVALATLSIITGFGISELTARSGIEPAGETVNRILKGDRSPLAFRIQPNAAHRPRQTNTLLETTSGSRLPVGCESLVSALAHSQLARMAGRCVS
jgi:hypothetical protein